MYGRRSHPHLDLLALRDSRDPTIRRLVEVAPIFFAEHEDDAGLASGWHLHLLEAAQLSQHRLQTLEANIELRHSEAIPVADVRDAEDDLGDSVTAATCLQAAEREFRVCEAEAEGETRLHLLRLVPAVAHECALGEGGRHVLAPRVVLAHPRVLPLPEAILAGLRDRDRQPSPGARFASEQHRDRGSDLLAGLEQQQRRIDFADPLNGDGTRRTG
mmetsp:Transcript_121857/g.350271  ORF Transcript_121857/g.350271 Transcript_121857/m.350271 type:complete len:216 (+) Transcript_121857:575-1222(+)